MQTEISENTPILPLQCPCGKTELEALERVHRGFLTKNILFWLPLKKYKCHKCKEIKWHYNNRKWF